MNKAESNTDKDKDKDKNFVKSLLGRIKMP
jgi:hypothetical protein